MDPIISACLETLSESKNLLNNLDDHVLSNTTIAPYHSSIGSHLRHILDFYQCILEVKMGRIDLTERNRDRSVENSCELALKYLLDIENRIKLYNYQLFDRIEVVDDMGHGKVIIPSTNASILAQANSHAIHHYAIINYILNGLKVELTNDRFGYNPTTP